jgi:hypothetical protein
MIEQELKFITKKVKIEFTGDVAHTDVTVKEFQKELEENYELRYEYPVSLSVQNEYLYITFLTTKKREGGKIGFGR